MLAVAELEHGVPGDVHELEIELDVASGLHLANHLERPLAEPAVRGVIEDDLGRYGYRPLVVVASATRCTASP
jgi:hypothetical protein